MTTLIGMVVYGKVKQKEAEANIGTQINNNLPPVVQNIVPTVIKKEDDKYGKFSE